MSRYAFIAACTEPWPVQLLCRVLGVSSAGYYQWRQRRAAARALWQAAAQDAFTRHAPAGCGLNYVPKGTRWGTRWGVTPCAPSCAERACAP